MADHIMKDYEYVQATRINNHLKTLDSDERRLAILELVCNDICIHCGDVNEGVCPCTRDE